MDVLHQESGPTITWSRVNMAESVIGVQTPLSWSFWDAGGEMGFRIGYHQLGLLPRAALTIPDSIDEQFTAIFYGHGACNINTFVTALAAMPGAEAAEEGLLRPPLGWRRRRRAARRARSPVARARVDARRRGRAAVAAAQARAQESKAFWRTHDRARARSTTPAAAASALAEALERFGPAVGMQIVASTFAGTFYGRVQQLLARVDRPDLELKLIGGYGSMQEIQLTQDLWRAAHAAGAHGAASTRSSPSTGSTVPPRGSCRVTRGGRIPAPIEAMMAKFETMNDDDAPEAAERRAARERKAAEREVLDAHEGLRPRAHARHARAQPPLHPAARRGEDRVHAGVRHRTRRGARHRRAARRRGHASSTPTTSSTSRSTSSRVDGLPTCKADGARAARHPRALRGRRPPARVGRHARDHAALRRRSADEVAATRHIEALGVSGGKAEGIARVLVDPNDPDALEPGDVLVCHTTDPSWSSHFFVASAVVIDIGGMLSHGAIVARELGIPCVISTGNGTSTIRSGDRVLVDGDAGTVEILERPKAGTPMPAETRHDQEPRHRPARVGRSHLHRHVVLERDRRRHRHRRVVAHLVAARGRERAAPRRARCTPPVCSDCAPT